MSLDAILSRIVMGEAVPQSELLPYLCLERREQRAYVNSILAAAYFKSGREANLQHAKVFIQRAWLLSRSSPQLLSLYKQIYSAVDDIPGIREAYKRVGMSMAAKGDISEAIKYFDLWQYTYVEFRNLDKYEYDLDILDCMDRLARPHRFSRKRRRLRNKKIRVAYLVKGIKELGSVLIMLNLLFAQYHDRARVEPLFFVPESEDEVFGSVEGADILQLFESYGCKVVMGPNVQATAERLIAVARSIYRARSDILVTSAALATFDHCFIAALRPAPVTIGLVQGPPQQFAPLSLDWGIAWNKRPLMDCPVNCSPLHMEQHLADRDHVVPRNRGEFQLPDDACVIASAGRYVKFQDLEFWKTIVDILADHPDTYFMALGVEETQIPFLSAILSPAIKSQIRFTGWRGGDYLRIVCLADIFIDTFPSGGGGVLVDAMALGIPVVSFRDNYMNLYDQTDWSPAEEIFDVPDLIVPRSDFAQMKSVVSRLIEDREFRADRAQRCRAYMLENKGNPSRAVRSSEDLYARILKESLAGAASSDPYEVEIEGLIRRARSQPATA
jgi:glycosyltransferase involved in cell wall biosynthesis